MTKFRRDGFIKDTDWTRHVPELDSRSAGLSIHDLDMVVHRYGANGQPLDQQYLMLVEQKRFGAKSDFAQRDTHQILHQMLSQVGQAQVVTARNQLVQVRYLGYHTLVMQGNTPDEGDIFWDDKRISRYDLIKRLRFDVDPRK